MTQRRKKLSTQTRETGGDLEDRQHPMRPGVTLRVLVSPQPFLGLADGLAQIQAQVLEKPLEKCNPRFLTNNPKHHMVFSPSQDPGRQQ